MAKKFWRQMVIVSASAPTALETGTLFICTGFSPVPIYSQISSHFVNMFFNNY